MLKVIFTPYIFLGLVLYAVAMVLWLSILSRVELSLAYPMLSLAYVFAARSGKQLRLRKKN